MFIYNTHIYVTRRGWTAFHILFCPTSVYNLLSKCIWKFRYCSYRKVHSFQFFFNEMSSQGDENLIIIFALLFANLWWEILNSDRVVLISIGLGRGIPKMTCTKNSVQLLFSNQSQRLNEQKPKQNPNNTNLMDKRWQLVAICGPVRDRFTTEYTRV